MPHRASPSESLSGWIRTTGGQRPHPGPSRAAQGADPRLACRRFESVSPSHTASIPGTHKPGLHLTATRMRTHQGRGLGRRPRYSATPVLGRLGRLPHHWASPVSRWNFSAARTRLAPPAPSADPATPPSSVSPTARAAGPSPGTRTGQVLQLAILGSYSPAAGRPRSPGPPALIAG